MSEKLEEFDESPAVKTADDDDSDAITLEDIKGAGVAIFGAGEETVRPV